MQHAVLFLRLIVDERALGLVAVQPVNGPSAALVKTLDVLVELVFFSVFRDVLERVGAVTGLDAVVMGDKSVLHHAVEALFSLGVLLRLGFRTGNILCGTFAVCLTIFSIRCLGTAGVAAGNDRARSS